VEGGVIAFPEPICNCNGMRSSKSPPDLCRSCIFKSSYRCLSPPVTPQGKCWPLKNLASPEASSNSSSVTFCIPPPPPTHTLVLADPTESSDNPPL